MGRAEGKEEEEEEEQEEEQESVEGSRNGSRKEAERDWDWDWAEEVRTGSPSQQTEATQKEPVGGALELDRADYVMDGARGWVVLAGVFVASLVQMGLTTTLGLYVSPLSDGLGLSLPAAAGGLSVLGATSTALGLFSPILYNSLGSRLCVGLGWATSTLGLLAAAWAPSKGTLYAAFATVGLGFNLALVPSNAALLEYFERYRLFALTFGSCGAALGGCVFPFITPLLLERVGWRGALVSHAGLISFVAVVAVLTRSRRRKDWAPPLSKIFRLDIFRQRSFWALSVCCLCQGGAASSFFILYPRLMEERGLGREDKSVVMLVQGLSNLSGRLLASWLNQLECTDRLLLNVGSGALWAGSLGGFGGPEGLAGLALVAGTFGFGHGLCFAGARALVVELFGAESMASAHGFAVFCLGLGQAAGPTAVSVLSEKLGLSAGLGLAAGMGGLGSLTLLLVRLCRYPSCLRRRWPASARPSPFHLALAAQSLSDAGLLSASLSLRSAPQ